MKKFSLYLAISILTAINACTQPIVSFESVATGLNQPVDVVEEKNDLKRLFVVEQVGTIRIINGSSFLAKPFLNVSNLIIAGGERGLLSMAFHPDYASNGYFFVWFNEKVNGDVTLARFTRSSTSADTADPASKVILLQVSKRFSNHNGAKLNFGPDGYLYVGTGDGGSGGDPDGNGQDSTSLLGKLLRIDVNNPNPPYYSIPPDNPFATSTTVRKEIIALGLRNPWRWSFDKQTGDIWLADVGQNLWEEVNMVPATERLNKNFGWKCFEGTHSYSGCVIAANNVVPVFDYTHDSNTGGFSITGGYVYRGTEFPQLQGYYLFVDYVSANGWLTKPNGSGGYTTTIQKNWPASITTFGEASNGTLYAASQNGTLYKIVGGEVLPVKLTSFMAAPSGLNHQINWSVQNEEAGDVYVIEKRTEPNQPFTEVQRQSVNTSKQQNSYSIKVPAGNGTAWYRLQIKSLRRATWYSQIVSLANQTSSILKGVIISNTLQLTLPTKAKTIMVFDSNGKLLLTKPVSNSVAERISLSGFSKGILAVHVQGDGSSQSIRVLY
ncbi:MAG: PQQ-dependent sugar dehydrogenase [Chitinophagaceae bacterium]|nr:PQQ-dependent sugar dehydrogenase [Chitinophagaceae bacterium]